MKTLHTIYTSFAKRTAIILTLLLTLGVTSAWAAEELAYTITFSNSANGATAIAISTQATTVIAENARTYVTTKPFSNITYSYYGGSTTDEKSTIRVGKSGNAGAITIALSESGKVSATKVVVNCKLYNSSKSATLSVNNQTAQNISSSYSDLTFEINNDLASLSLATSQYAYIKSISVYKAAAPTTHTVTIKSNNVSYGTVDPATIADVANNAVISMDGNRLTVGSTTVTATPAEKDANYSYSFNNWSGIPSGNKVTANCTITANFTRTDRALTNYRTTCSTQASYSTYTVKHCKEGLEAGSYPDDLIETETLEGTIGDKVTPGRKNYTGFTAPSGQTETILENGALVVTYKYTRKSFTLTWELGDGIVTTEGTAAEVGATGTISKEVRYGTPITAPIVQREGYRFNKWDSSVSNEMPANDKSFTATWVKTWNITWKAQGNTIQEVTVDADNKLTLPTEEVATCEGMTHIGWTEIEHYTSDTDAPDDFFTYAIGTVSENKIYHAVYALSCGYTKLDWGSEVPEGKYLISTGTNTIYGQNGTTKTYLGATAYAPTRELKPEYEVCIRKVGTAFAIQLLNTMWVGLASSSSTNTNLTTDSPETDAAYTWKYTKNGIQNQSAESRYLQINGTGSEGRVYTTTGSGSTWHPTYLYARNNGGYYTTCQTSVAIDYDLNGGTGNMSNTRVKSGSDYIIPTAVPTQVGKTFTHWSDGTNTYAAGATINDLTNDIILTAQWKVAQHTVTLNPNYPDGKTGTFKDKGGNTVSGNLVLTYDYNTASMTIASLYTSLTLDGYEFGGWHNAKGSNPGEVSGSKCTTTGDITGNKTYFAKWSKLYTITLSENGTTRELTPQTSTSYTLPETLSVGNCENDEKELVGWSTVAIPNPGDKPTSNFYELGATVTLTADQTTFYAVFATAEGSQNVFKRMQTLDELNNASKIAIINAYSSSAYILNTSLTAAAKAPEESSSKITVTEGQYWTLEKSNSYWKFKNSDNKYLTTNTIPTSSSKYGSVQLATSGNNEWVIAENTYTNNGTPVFTIYNASSKNAGLEYSNGWILYYSTDFNTSWFTLKLYVPDVSYSDYTTTCVKLPDPVLSFDTEPANPIEFTDAVCGGNSSKQSVTVVGENLRDVVEVSVTGPYKIARTASTALKDFNTSLTLDKTAAGAIHSNYQTVYIISTPPAQSTEATTGTLTFTTTKGNTLTVNLSTQTVTCAQYTLTLNDRGTKTTAEYYAGASVPKPEDPTGVCTDPIHYVFDGWATSTVAGGSTTYTKVSFPYTMPAKATTLYAVYRYTEGNANSDKFMSVDKELGELVSGMDYVLTGNYDSEVEYAISITTYETGKYKTKLVDVQESSILYEEDIPYYEFTTTDNEIIWTIEGDEANGYTFQNKSNNKYLAVSADKLTLSDNAAKFTIEHETGVIDGEDVYYMSLLIQPVGSTKYLSSYYKDATAGVLFNLHTNLHTTSTLSLYLYKRVASNLYTTSPACGPMLEITSGKDIYVTSGYGTGRNTVIAQQTVEYRATRLKTQNGSAEGTAPDVKVAANGVTMGGVVTNNVKVVELTQNKELIGDKYTITGTVTVQYTPTANNLQEDIQVQLAVDYNTDAKDNFTVHARSLPSEFVIAAKQGDKWYALNADMSGSDAEKANGYLQVDDIEDPTKATFAPCNTIYTFDGMVDGGNKEYMRFQGIDGKYLWAASAGNTGIQNYAKNTPTAGTIAYNWQLYTNDNETYQLQNEGNGRTLGLSKDLNFGMYSYVSTLQQYIRILPYVEKCIYNYAPTNLKVSVLKSTYVTLTWDAVAGATKYQYSTNGTTWTDAGTEPTVTINGLTRGNEYIYYVRAYHEDAGVSQECIDYAEITFTTADCDDVPTDITYTADLNSITVSWTAAAPTATITYNTKEDGTGGGGTISKAKSPCRISGGLKKNTTYYIQILSNGTCASPIIPVKTEDVEVDIVEWQPHGIIVDINTDETVGVTLENEVSYGSGAGAEATELFFSKYYEATGNVKLVAIYNGTKNIIDLTDYEIHYGKDSWESQHITLKDFGETKGQIQPGEELILYTTNESNDDNKILDCVNKQYPDGKWVRVTQANNAGGGYLSFAGNKTLVLKKASTIIDVIGALNSDRSKPTSTNANEWPSWGDAAGWNCATGLSIADDTQIGISTNRCLLIRNNTVTSGENAVTSNIDDFVTLCSEWKGAQVPDNNVDNGVAASCENFAYVGTFDYSDYYTQYESMGDEKEFDENARNADGTVTIPITDLYKQSCRNIRVKLSDKDGNVLTDREYKVPIMITTTQGTDGQAFLNLQENLATVEVDGNGDPTGNKTNLTLAQAKEICKTCDVVVRDNAILTKADDDAADDHPEVRDVYVYENSSLIVPNGTNYTINSLSLRRKQDAVASVNAYPDALKLPASAAAPISLDFRLSAESWHWFTLPYDCNISEVTWVDGSPAQYNVDWFLMTYDGEKRAATQAGGCWKAHTGTTIKAGEGFILAINGNINNPAHTYELRFPMSKEVLAAEGTDKPVAVRAWGVETNIRPNHKGWNLVGNPYLAYYQRNNITNFEGLRLGQLTGPDPQTGYWEQTGEVPYIVVPVGAGWVAYEQVLASDIDLLPFTAYFVQVGNDGTHNSTQDLKVAFDHTKLQLSATPMPASIIQRSATEDEEPIIVGVSLTNAKGESDKTSLIIDDQYTDEYEMHADFFKWFGDYYTYYTKPVLYTVGADQGKRAFNALNEELATQPVALGMYAAQAGEYTFTLDLRSDLSHVEEIWLHDATENIYTNLLQDSYTFSTGKINGEGRFFLSVKMKPQQEPDPDPEPTPDPTPDSDPETSLDDIVANRVFATVKDNVIYISGLLSDAQLWIYDAAGRLMHYDQTKYYQHTYLVPQGGAYFVRVQGTMQTQTIKVVVK